MPAGSYVELPPAECEYGYTRSQLAQILGLRLAEFDHWMRGQTMALCDGVRFDVERGRYVQTKCGPHGPTVYGHDLRRFLEGRPVID